MKRNQLDNYIFKLDFILMVLASRMINQRIYLKDYLLKIKNPQILNNNPNNNKIHNNQLNKQIKDN
jgi:hypothetical protein